jgi:3-oxoacyl-(acyl-carrier-protein) synthase
MALKTGDLPPQINLLEPEPEISKLLVGQGENSKISAALSVNLGFGGSTAAVVFTKE